MIYLIEFEGARPVSEGGAVSTLRFCTGTGYISAPTDDPPLAVYEARVLTPGTLSRHLWQPGTTRGRGEVGYGSVELANADGDLDYLVQWALDGRPIRILRGSARMARADFEVALRGIIDGVTVSMRTVVIRLRDRAGEVAGKPLVTARYGGTNVLPAGVDGTADDIKGQVKPLVLGEVENVLPPRVNNSHFIYQLSAAAVAEVVSVWEGGNAITKGTLRANVATLDATAPTAATWDYSLGNDATGEGAYIRLGSTPALPITAYVREGSTTALRTTAQVAARILARGGVPASDLLGVADLDGTAGGVVGFWAGSDATVGDAMDAVCSSVGAAWTPTRDGRFRLARLVDPASAAVTPAVEIIEAQLLADGETTIRLLPTGDGDRGVPACEAALRYQRNWNPMQGGDLAGVVAVVPARRDWLQQEWRTTTVSDASVWSPDTRSGRHPMSAPIEADSLLRNASDAATEATRLMALYGRQRMYLSISVHAALVADLELGDVVRLTAARFGLDNGRDFILTGMVEDFAADRSELYLWG